MSSRSRRITFPSARGERLAGRLELPPDGRPMAWALFAHCFTCSKDLKAAGHLTRELNAHRIAVLRFDFTGLGESEGDFADTTFSSNVADLEAACRYLAEEHEAPSLLIGHSLGGAAVLQAAARLPAVRAVATLGAPYDPQHITHLFGDREAEIRARGEATVTLAGRAFTIRKEFLEDLAAANVDEVLRNLKRALLVMHSPVDNLVGIENAARIYQAAKHPKSFISLDDADHLLTREADARYAARVLAAWVSRYVDAPAPASREALRLENRVAARIGASGFRTDVMANGHGLIADEPESVGGTNLGPTPYDLLAAALATCTAMTVRMYADRKDWPLEGIEVGVSHSRIHADDEEHCEDAPAKLDRFDRDVLLAGDALDADQRTRLLEIADKCPVHKTLSAGVRIETEMVED